MNTNRFRNTGNPGPRRLRPPSLHWWSGFRSRSKRPSPTPYWNRTTWSPALNRLRWKSSQLDLSPARAADQRRAPNPRGCSFGDGVLAPTPDITSQLPAGRRLTAVFRRSAGDFLERAVELRDRLEADFQRDRADAKVRVLEKVLRFLDPHTPIINKGHPSRLLETLSRRGLFAVPRPNESNSKTDPRPASPALRSRTATAGTSRHTAAPKHNGFSRIIRFPYIRGSASIWFPGLSHAPYRGLHPPIPLAS